jgi:uncharacterized membrane protein YdjX (TVP38/TMEM64 family)
LGRTRTLINLFSSASLVVAVTLVICADPPAMKWAQEWINALGQLFLAQPGLAVLLFCFLHLLSSVLGLPGACTTLNITSGAVFGFWLGCLVVYPITILSALMGYFFGHRFKRAASAYVAPRFFRLAAADNLNYFDLVALRISPLIPFPIVNIFLGSMGISLPLFLSSTFVGVFFDVALLNGLGARIMRPAGSGRTILVFAFLFLSAASWAVKKCFYTRARHPNLFSL